tara:strand:- start:2148 stop:2252 length:105 start_codon:yes stop_codon:yes gene_type:complete
MWVNSGAGACTSWQAKTKNINAKTNAANISGFFT